MADTGAPAQERMYADPALKLRADQTLNRLVEDSAEVSFGSGHRHCCIESRRSNEPGSSAILDLTSVGSEETIIFDLLESDVCETNRSS